MKLVFAVYDRLDKVHERLDDSGGYRFVLMGIIATNLTKIFRRQPWSSEQRADWLIQMINAGHEEFPLIPDDFKLTDEETQFLYKSTGKEQDICLFYLEEKMFDKAVCWLDNHVADKYLLKDAACLLITHNPQKAIEYCRQALTHILNISSNASYSEAVKLLDHLYLQLPEQEAIQQQFTTLILEVAFENKRRPNMIKLLRQTFSELTF